MNAGTIGGIIILVLIIGYFAFKYYKKSKSEEEDLELRSFLNSIRETVEDAMLKYLSNIDIHNITNINDMQKQVLNDLYSTVWDLCIAKLGEEVDPDVAKLIKLLLTRDVVEAFIQEVYESSIDVQEAITTKYNNAVLASACKD